MPSPSSASSCSQRAGWLSWMKADHVVREQRQRFVKGRRGALLVAAGSQQPGLDGGLEGVFGMAGHADPHIPLESPAIWPVTAAVISADDTLRVRDALLDLSGLAPSHSRAPRLDFQQLRSVHRSAERRTEKAEDFLSSDSPSSRRRYSTR